MPKPLWEWLHLQAIRWHMPGTAYKTSHGGIWHRFEGEELPGHAICGAWLSENWVRRVAGRHQVQDNPWSESGGLKVSSLCHRCFIDELPLLRMLQLEQLGRSDRALRLDALAEAQK